jgi:hypothetical protein
MDIVLDLIDQNTKAIRPLFDVSEMRIFPVLVKIYFNQIKPRSVLLSNGPISRPVWNQFHDLQQLFL